MCKKILNNNRGFSFIDVLVATVLFSFLVVGVLLMTSMGIKTNSWAQHHSKAVQLAESSLEMLRRVDYNDVLPAFDGISAMVETPKGVTIHPVSDYGQIPNYPEFRQELLTQQDPLDPNLYTLQVTVIWRISRNVRSNPIVLTTQRVGP